MVYYSKISKIFIDEYFCQTLFIPILPIKPTLKGF